MEGPIVKIKKVEIQAFRAYDDLKDGTFNFLTTSNDIADFISIYAPNGFGKTSFYDAVEWGVTNNLSRFLKNKTENLHLARFESEKYIIRNKFSSNETNTFVKVYTDINSSPIENKLNHKGMRSNQRDMKFDSTLTKHDSKYFLDVILSQDGIDSFLKEDDSSIRYNKFIDSFGDKDLDKKYKKIIELIKINKIKTKECSNKIVIVRKLLKSEFDDEILFKVNSAIKSMNKKGSCLPNISPNFTEKDNLKFSDLLSEKVKDLELKLRNLEDREYLIYNILAGKSHINTGDYYNSINEINVLDKELVLLNSYRNSFNESVKLENEIVNLNVITDYNINNKLSIINYIDSFPRYKIVRDDIDKIKNEILECKNIISKTGLSLAKCRQFENENKNTKKIIDDKLKELYIKNNGVDEHYDTLTLKSEQKNKLEEYVKVKKIELNNHISEIQLIESKIHPYINFLDEIKNNEYPVVVDELFKDYTYLIEKINLNVVDMLPLEREIANINNSIAETENLNYELKKLVELGSSLVIRNESTDCPLCMQSYSDFNSLANKISTNPTLDKNFKSLIVMRNVSEEKLSKLKSNTSELKFKLKSKLSNYIESQKSFVYEKKHLNMILNSKIEDLKKQLDLLENDLDSIRADTYRLNKDKFIIYLSDNINSLEKEKGYYNLLLEGVGNEIKEKEDLISNLSSKIDSLEYNIDSFSNITEYKLIVKNNKLDVDNLNKELSEINSVITKDAHTLSTLKNRKLIVDNIITGQELDDLNHKIDLAVTMKNHFKNKKITIERYFLNNINKNIKEFDSVTLVELLENETKNIKENTEEIKIQINDYNKIGDYKENVLPFLKHQSNLKKYSSLSEELVFLNETVKVELERERKKVSRFIHENIKSFFFQELINSIYGKIDPHPKYKDISFDCDFSQEKPRLHILVSDESGGIVPNLYFSSAQLNILSLSIFLAKALNVSDPSGKPVNCIFIDDPIQAMDSINILSIIDLFRSIVANMGKQIILSTHDENFHKLLKMKIPPELFKSRYIELESFGKVKQGPC